MSIIADIQNDLDRGALRLVSEYRGRLLSEAIALCKDESHAEDLVIQTLDRAIRHINSCKQDENLLAWMKSILKNVYLDDGKRGVSRKTVLVTEEEMEELSGGCEDTMEQIIRNSDHDALREALAGLDEKYKKVISMYYFNELSLKDIARFLNTSPSTVSRRIITAKRILAAKLRMQFTQVKKPMAVLVALLLGLSAAFGGWKAAEALGWLPAEEAPRTEEAQLAAEEEVAEETISSDSNLTQEKGTTTMNLKAVKSVAAAAATALTLSASAEPVTPAIPASAYIQDGLIAQWDGIDNIGIGQHNSSATEWVDLKGGESWALQAKGSFSENALVCAGGGLAAKRTASIMGIQTMDIRFLCDTLDASYIIFTSGQRTGGYSCYLGTSTPTKDMLVGYRKAISCEGQVAQSVCVLYDLANDLYSTPPTAYYRNGESGGDLLASPDMYGASMDKASLGARIDGSYHFAGQIFSLRLYNRKLTADEITLNANLDKVRFEGVDPKTIEWPETWPEGSTVRWNRDKCVFECLMTVTSTAANPISVNDGVYVAETNAWFEVGAPMTVKCQVADHHRVARWDGAPFDAVVGENQITFAASVFTISPIIAYDMPASAYIQDGLIAQWDGIENAGAGTHNSNAKIWKDLVGSRDFAINAGEAFDEDCLVITSGGSHITTGWALSKLTFEFRLMQTSGSASIRRWDADPWQQTFESWSSNEGFLERIGSTRLATTVPVNGSIYNLVTRYASNNGHRFQSTVNGVTTARSGAASITIPATFNFLNGGANVNVYAIRVYDRELTDDEVTFNANVDKVRYEYADPATLTWPEGTRWNSEKGAFECRVTVTSTAANPISVNDGVYVAETNAWFEFGASVTVKCQVANGYRLVRWDGAPADAVVGENQITFAASVFTISPIIAYDISASAYVQRGLIAQWDGIENAGLGQHDNAATEWVDLSGKAFNWTINSANGGWTEFGLCAKSAANMATYGAVFKDFDTVEVRFDHSESTADRYLICWGDTANKRMLAEVKTGSYGGPAFFLTTGGQTQRLVAESTNTVAGTYENNSLVANYVNGETAIATGTKDTFGSKGEVCYLLRPGGKSFFAIRCYNRALSANEIALNAAIDQVRYEYVDPADLTWPTGVRFQNGIFEVCLSVTFDSTKGSVKVNGKSVTSGEKVWVEKDSAVTLVATPAANCKLKTWSGYYFDDLPTFERQDLQFSLTANMPANLGAQFVDESAGVYYIPDDFETPAAALASSDVVEGDIIRIRPGSYTFPNTTDILTGSNFFATVRKAVKIEGEGGVESVIINCGGEGGFLLDNANAVLCGVTLTNFNKSTVFKSLALHIVQGVVSNVVAKNGGGSGAFGTVVYVGEKGLLVDSEVSNVIKSDYIGGSAQIIVDGGTLRSVTYKDCKNTNYGLSLKKSSNSDKRPLLENCKFLNNAVLNGVISCNNGDLVHCLFCGNSGEQYSMLLNLAGTVKATDCIFSNNVWAAKANIPMVNVASSRFEMENCLMVANKSYTGGLFKLTEASYLNGTLIFENCTVFDNISEFGSIAGIVSDAGAVEDRHAVITMRNTIFRNNLARDVDVEFADLLYTDFTFDHSCYTGRPIEEGSMDVNPMFEDASAGNYRLAKGSPCVDTGVNNELLPTDLDGKVRPQDGNGDGLAITDMGCYEKPEPTEALEVALAVEMLEATSPARAKLTATVTGRKLSGLEFDWYAIRTLGGVVTTNTAHTSEATYTFTELEIGQWVFACKVANDAIPPDTAIDTTKDAFSVKPATTYVSLTGGNVWPYNTEANAARNLQDAVEAAGEKVIVKAGIYKNFTHFTDETTSKECLCAVHDAISVEGEDETTTIIDCGGLGGFVLHNMGAALSGVTLTNFVATAEAGMALYANPGNLSHVTFQGGTTLVRGVDIIDLEEYSVGEYVTIRGLSHAINKYPAVLMRGATLRNSIIEDCQFSNIGNQWFKADKSEYGTRSHIEKCTFRNNTSEVGLLEALRTDITDSIFSGNTSKLYLRSGAWSLVSLHASTLANCVIVDNTSSVPVAFNNYYDVSGTDHNSLTNCLIASNRIAIASLNVEDAPQTEWCDIINCTIANNVSCPVGTGTIRAGGIAWGVDASRKGKLRIVNTIVWENFITNGVGEVVRNDIPTSNTLGSRTVELRNCCFSEADEWESAEKQTVVNNIAENPLFRKPARKDFTLRSVSPCVDTGDNLNWKKKTDKDLLGQPRIQNRIIDMGCYEVQRVGTVFFIR